MSENREQRVVDELHYIFDELYKEEYLLEFVHDVLNALESMTWRPE